MYYTKNIVSFVLFFYFLACTAFAQGKGGVGGGTGGGGGGGGTGYGFPIAINDIQFNSTSNCNSPNGMLLNISVSPLATLPSSVYVYWEDSNGNQGMQLAPVTGEWINAGQVLVTGFQAGTTLVGIRVCPASYAYLTVCSYDYTSPHFPHTFPHLLCIDNATPTPITQCNVANGGLQVQLNGGTNGAAHQVRLLNNGVDATTPRTVNLQNNLLNINDIAHGVSITSIEVRNLTNNAIGTYNLTYTWQSPPQPQISLATPINSVCDGEAGLQVTLGNAGDFQQGTAFSVRLNGGALVAQAMLQGNTLTISNIPQSFVLSSVVVTEPTTQCSSAVFAVAYTYPVTKLLLGTITKQDPVNCNGWSGISGKLLIGLQNGVQGRDYEVFIGSNPNGFTKTFYNGVLEVGRDVYGIEFFPVGSQISNIRVKDKVTGCEVSQVVNIVFEKPAFSITGHSKIEPLGVCGAKGTLILQVPNSAGKTYRFNLQGTIYMYSNPYPMPYSYPYMATGNGNNELVIEGFSNGTIITGVYGVYGMSTQCFYDFYYYQFTQQVVFNQMTTAPEISRVTPNHPASCNGTGNFWFHVNTQNSVPAWNQPEDVEVTIFTPQGLETFVQQTNGIVYTRQFPNNTTLYRAEIKRLSSGCTALWNVPITLQSPDLPRILQVRQHKYTRCNEPMEIDIQLVNPNPTDTYEFNYFVPGGGTYTGTRLPDGWYHIKQPFYTEGQYILSFAMTNVTKGCTNYQSGVIVNLQKYPPLVLNSATLIQPEKCEQKGKIALNGYLFLENEPYEVKLNDVSIGTFTLSSPNANYILVDDGHPAITKIELIGKNTCTPAILYTNLPAVRNLNPFKVISHQVTQPATCGGIGSLSLRIAGAESNRTYRVKFTANRTIPDFLGQVVGSWQTITMNSYFADGTEISQVEVIDEQNPSCKTPLYVFNPKLRIASPYTPIIGERGVEPLPVACGQWQLLVRADNLDPSGAYSVQFNLNGTPMPPAQVGLMGYNGSGFANGYLVFDGQTQQPMLFTEASQITNFKVINYAYNCAATWGNVSFQKEYIDFKLTPVNPTANIATRSMEVKFFWENEPAKDLPAGNYTVNYEINNGLDNRSTTAYLAAQQRIITLNGLLPGQRVCLQSITIDRPLCIRAVQNTDCDETANEAPCAFEPDVVAENKDYHWIKTTTYGFGSGNTAAVLSESKSYFDQSGSLLQSQSKDFFNCVLWVTEPMKDRMNRVIGQTLPGLVENNLTNGGTGFAYQPYFVRNEQNTAYTWRDYDDTQTLFNPKPVGSAKNTLGWYYSNQNGKEPYSPKTAYPYSRLQYYDKGTNEVKRSSGAGETFKMGAGKEPMSKSFPVSTELNEYATWRSRTSPLSKEIASFAKLATKTVSRDVNGKEAVVFADKTGKMLASAIFEGNGGEVPSETTLRHELDLPFYWVNIEVATQKPANSIETQSTIRLYGNFNHVKVFDRENGSVVFEGRLRDSIEIATYYTDKDSKYQVRSEGSFTFKVGHKKTSVYEEPVQGQPDPRVVSYTHTFNTTYTTTQSPRLSTVQFHIPVAQPTTISIENPHTTQATATLTDLVQDQQLSTTPAVGGGVFQIASLAGGFYELALPTYKNLLNFPYQVEYQPVVLLYNYKLYNLSYTFYNDAGGVYATVSPNGVAQHRNEGIAWNNIDKSTALYNSAGQVISQTETDAGTTRYIYAKDGRIRFSQSAKQAAQTKMSFTDYDEWLRPVRSGERFYVASFEAFNNETATENQATIGDLYVTDVVKTGYDFADTECPRQQKKTAGQVAWTEKLHHSKTWYSYDDRGLVTWTVQRMKFGLGNAVVFKTLDYSYDKMGNVLAVTYQKGTTEEFIHRFEYDKVYRLARVYVKPYGQPAQLLATYTYYYHGGLKRVETGNQLQGTDYVYTLQGWLKSINGLAQNQDPGKDGVNNQFAPDVFGSILGYFQNDYQPVSLEAAANMATVSSPAQALYNGSITTNAWAYGSNANLSQNDPNQKRAYSYAYDHKYQLKEANYGTFTGANGNYGFTNSTTQNFFEGGLTYDLNGNIKTLKRNDANGVIQANYDYHFATKADGTKTNQLSQLKNNNVVHKDYFYDEIGQLIKESKNGSEIRLTYDVTGKVTAVHDGQNVLKVTFRYDDKGQRMEKINYQTGLHTWYINDAGGQVVRIYEKQAQSPLTPEGGKIKDETPLYGMSRVGIWQQTYDKPQPNAYSPVQGVAFADYIYEAKDHLGNVRVTYRSNNEQAEQTYQTMDLEHENAQSWEQDHNDLRNFSNSNAWRSYAQKHDGKFSLKISPVPQQPQPQPQKVAQFRLPVRKGERWTATVWAKWGRQNESPPAPEGGVRSPQLKSPQRGVKSPPAPKGGVTSLRKTPLWGGGLLGLAVSTPLFLPQGENQGLSFNVLAAVPLAVQLTKSLRLAKSQRLSKFGHNLSGGSQPPDRSDFKPETPPFVTESVEAYLLVELLNEKGEVINPAYRKYFVTSQDDFTKIGSEDNEPIDFGDECTQTGFLRFSLVNEHEQQPAYFDAFEIVHKPNAEKLTVTSWTDYYPFGKVAKTACSGAGAYRYGYQGEFAEKDGETDWNSFELRQYDSDIARWLSVDPYGQYWSPYVAMGNDPGNQVDADGGWSGGGGGGQGGGGGEPQYTGGTLPEVTVIGYRESPPMDFAMLSASFWSMMRAGDSYANGNENSIFANIGRFVFDVIPAGSAVNAYSGYTTGQNIFGESMGATGVALNTAGAIPGGKGVALALSPLTKLLVYTRFAVSPIGRQVHHIIPQGVYKNLKNSLDNIGFDIHSTNNLIPLQTPFHGNHPALNTSVQSRLQRLIDAGTLDVNQIRQLQAELRMEIDDALQRGYNTLNEYYK